MQGLKFPKETNKENSFTPINTTGYAWVPQTRPLINSVNTSNVFRLSGLEVLNESGCQTFFLTLSGGH